MQEPAQQLELRSLRFYLWGGISDPIIHCADNCPGPFAVDDAHDPQRAEQPVERFGHVGTAELRPFDSMELHQRRVDAITQVVDRKRTIVKCLAGRRNDVTD